MKTFLAIVALALTGILSAQEITPQRGVSFNATGILPAHDHSSPRNGAISGAAKLAIVNVGDQNTAFTLDNTLDGTSRAPFIQFRKRTTAGTPAPVGAVLGQLTFDSDNVVGPSAEIRATVRVAGSNGVWPVGSSLDFMTAPGNASTVAQSRLYISELGAASFSGSVTASSITSKGNIQVPDGSSYKNDTYAGTIITQSNDQTINANRHVLLQSANGGSVGIGTAAPGTKLHMSSGTLTIDGNTQARITMQTVNENQQDISFKGSGGGDNGGITLIGSNQGTANRDGYLEVRGVNGIGFRSNAGELARITSGGSVGIGTASPATTLDVNGNAQFGSGATKSTFTATGHLTAVDGDASNASLSFGNSPNTGFFRAAASQIGVAANGSEVARFDYVVGIKPFVRTKAQIDAITPLNLGSMLVCSDCAVPYSICTATGTTLSGFRRADSTTAGCGTNN